MAGNREYAVERRKGARADHGRRARRDGLDADLLHATVSEVKVGRDELKKLGALSPRLDQPNRALRQDRDDETGKAGAGAQIDPFALAIREREELNRINDMAAPDIRLGRCGDQILVGHLVPNQIREPFELAHCSTWNIEHVGQPGARFLLGHAAFRRPRTRIAESAAGVTPRTRWAAASVRGRAAFRRSIISAERPAIEA